MRFVMPTPQMVAALVKADADAVGETLRQFGRVADTAEKLAAFAMARIEHALELRGQGGGDAGRRLPVCKSGCSWCCTGIRVDVTAPEAILIGAWLRNCSAPDELTRVLERLAETAEAAQGLGIDDYAKAMITCAFLDRQSGLCSIYPVRPLACRGHNSFDAARCEHLCKSPEAADDTILADVVQNTLTQACRVGLCEGMDSAGLDARPLELANAVGVALRNGNAAAEWISGDQPFDAAALRTHQADETAVARTERAIANRGGPFAPIPLKRKVSSRNERKRRRRARKGK